MPTPASQAASFEPEEFGRVVGIAIRAGQAPASGGTAKDCDPYHLAARALREEFDWSPEKFESAMDRFAALMHLFVARRLQDWVRTSPGRSDAQDIHPAVIHAAAQTRLKRNGRFPERRFLERVREIAGRYYATLDDWD